MSVLDAILVKELINTPTMVSVDFSTESIDISNRQDEFSVQVNYDSGNGSVNMTLVLEVSNDDVNFVPMATQVITDDNGTHIFDAAGTGTRYLRVSVLVSAGSMTLQDIKYDAKRLH